MATYQVKGKRGLRVVIPAGSGDVTGPSSSVDSEVAIFSGATGKIIKRAAVTGLAKLASGVLSAVTTWAGAALTGTASHVATFDGSGNPSSKAVGTGAGTIAAGDDSRFIAAASATDKVLARTSSGGGAWEETPYGDPAQAIGALATPSRVLGQGVEYDASGTLGWRSALDCIARRWSVYYDSTIGTIGTSNATISPTTAVDATGVYAAMTTSASAGAKVEHRDGASRKVYQPRHGAEIAWVVSPQHTTTVLYWCSSTSAQTSTPTGDTLAGHGVGFRYSTDAVDAGWTFCTRDGTTQNTTATGIAVTAGNVYVLVASTLDAGVTWRWRVYDVTAGTTATGTTTTNVPGTSTSMGWQYLVEARAASARSMWGYGLSGVHGGRA